MTTKFEDEIESKGCIVYTNVGDSMMPLLRENKDIIVIKKIAEPLKKYDVVLFKRPNGAYVLHRIVKVLDTERYSIAGDNRSFSEIVPRNWIIGVLSEVIKDGKHISVESDEYKAYLKKLPIQRFKLKCISVFGSIKRKLKIK